ncbi:hypothetical protein N9J39_03000 [Flavicella sp.]|nr:hypothetical protein [Flavicella sp.]MDA9111820.1 hypothetical protein [Flavicella sp.]
MKRTQKELGYGFFTALFATLSGVILYLELFSKHSYSQSFQMIEEGGLYGEILSLGALPNLFVFFIYIKKRQDNRAKGVLLATLCIAFATLVLKFS